MNLDKELEAYALPFKPIAEQIVEGELSDDEYLNIVVGLGVEKMVEEIIRPREASVLWNTILGVLARDPGGFAEFMLETLEVGAADDSSSRAERWERYIS